MENRLKALRAERGWSQAELADRLDVSRQSVNAIEVGKYDPSLPLAFKIARLFGQPIEAIFRANELVRRSVLGEIRPSRVSNRMSAMDRKAAPGPSPIFLNIQSPLQIMAFTEPLRVIGINSTNRRGH